MNAHSGAAPERRLLLLGLDGADEGTLGAALHAGRMPRLAHVLRGRAALPSTPIPITPAAWTTIYTGMNPGKTGVLTWQKFGADRRARTVNGRDAGPLGFVHRLSGAGKRVAFIGFPLTFPIDVPGAIVFPGWDAPVGELTCNDPVWAKRAAALGYRPDELSIDEAVLAGHIRERFRLAAEIDAHIAWDVLGVYVAFIDHLGHRVGTGNAATPALLEIFDREFGSLLDRWERAPEVLVCSDHGFGRFSRAFAVSQWLEERGFLAYASREVERGSSDAPKALAWTGLRFSVDWSRTTAFCIESMGSYAGIRVNTRGTYADGIVAPRAARALLEDARAQLLDVRDPVSGERIVKNVWFRDELFWGPFVHELPDLVLETLPDTVALFSKWDRDGEALSVARGAIESGTFYSHRPDGFWGSSFSITGLPRVEDVAPTVYAVLGVPVPDDVDGENRADVAATTGAAPGVMHGDESAYTPEEEELVRKRLEALGYL